MAIFCHIACYREKKKVFCFKRTYLEKDMLFLHAVIIVEHIGFSLVGGSLVLSVSTQVLENVKERNRISN